MPLSGGGATPARIDDFNALCRNPFERNLHEPILAYRIITPALAWLLGLRGFSGVILQYLAIPATLGLIFHAMASRAGRSTALLATVGVACSYTMIWTNTKPGFPDSITHLAVASLLVTRNPCLIVAATILGTLNDERFVLAIPFLLLWHAPPGSFGTMVKSTWANTLLYVCALIIVLIVRTSLENGIIGPGIQQPEVYKGFHSIASFQQAFPRDGWHQYGVNIFMSFRFLWLIVPVALISISDQAHRVVFAFFLVLTVLASGFVADVSRSIGFAFPALLIGMTAISNAIARPVRFLTVLVALCLLLPSFFVTGSSSSPALDIQLERPLPLSLMRAVNGWDAMDLMR